MTAVPAHELETVLNGDYDAQEQSDSASLPKRQRSLREEVMRAGNEEEKTATAH